MVLDTGPGSVSFQAPKTATAVPMQVFVIMALVRWWLRRVANRFIVFSMVRDPDDSRAMIQVEVLFATRLCVVQKNTLMMKQC